MPATSMALAFTLGATLSNDHSRAIGRVTKDLNGLGRTVTDLSKTARTLDEFGKKRDTFLKTAAGVHEAQKRLAELKAEMAKSPSPELERKVQAAARAMDLAKTRAFDQRRGLNDLRRELRSAGVDTNRYTQEQNRLSDAIRRNNALARDRARLGQAWRNTAQRGAIAAGAVMATGRTLGKPINLAANFQDQIRQIAITGEAAGTNEERQLGQAVLHASQQYRQSTTDINAGVGALVARGASIKTAIDSVGDLTKMTTATRASFEDLASVLFAFQNTLGVEDWRLAFDQMAKAGKLGSFEIKDMARAMPELTARYKALGVTGNEAVVSAASRLQISKFTAADSGQAATNLNNFLTQLTSQRTLNNFDKLGIDLQGRLKDAAAHGVDPVKAAITLIGRQIAASSPVAKKTFANLTRDLAKITDPVERAAEMQRRQAQISAIGESFGLGELFRDQGAASYLMAELQNQAELARIMDEVRSSRGTMDKDFSDQVELSTSRMQAAAGAWNRVGIVVGETLKPLTDTVLDAVAGMGNAISGFAEGSPKAFIAAISAVGAALAGGTLLSVVRFGGAVLGLGRALGAFGLSRTVAAGGSGLMGRALRFGGARLGVIGASLATIPDILTAADSSRGTGERFRAGASAGGTIAGGLAGAKLGALVGTMIAPGIGTTVGGILGSVVGAVAGEKALSGITAAVQQWGPAVLAAVVDWSNSVVDWGRGLPQKIGDALRVGRQAVIDAGRELVSGITEGIQSRYAELKATVTGLGTSAVDWFKTKLDIHSPSRVFFGLGQMVADGAAGGIGERAGRVAQAAAGLGLAASMAFAPGAMAAGVPGPARAAVAAPNITQTITIQIVQQAGEDTTALAQRVAAELQRQSRGAAMGALGDWA